jgi:hypothetical protein
VRWLSPLAPLDAPQFGKEGADQLMKDQERRNAERELAEAEG